MPEEYSFLKWPLMVPEDWFLIGTATKVRKKLAEAAKELWCDQAQRIASGPAKVCIGSLAPLRVAKPPTRLTGL